MNEQRLTIYERVHDNGMLLQANYSFREDCSDPIGYLSAVSYMTKEEIAQYLGVPALWITVVRDPRYSVSTGKMRMSAFKVK